LAAFFICESLRSCLVKKYRSKNRQNEMIFRSFEKNSLAICRKGSGKAAILMVLQPIHFLTKQLLNFLTKQLLSPSPNTQTEFLSVFS